jgi:hypothetical protein
MLLPPMDTEVVNLHLPVDFNLTIYYYLLIKLISNVFLLFNINSNLY